MRFCKLIVTRCRNDKPDEHPCHSIFPFKFDEEGVKIEIVKCSVMTAGIGHSMISISSAGPDIPSGHFKTDIGECEISRITSSQHMALVTNRKCLLADIVCKSDCHLVSAIPHTDFDIEWTVMGQNTEKIHSLISNLKENGYGVEIISANKTNLSLTLTAKQQDYLDTAYELGYYDIPKKITIDEICLIIGCSKSSFNVTLRNAEKKIIGLHILSGTNNISSLKK